MNLLLNIKLSMKIIRFIIIFILIIIYLINNLYLKKRKYYINSKKYYNCYFINENNNLELDDNINCFKKGFISINNLIEIENHSQEIDALILDFNVSRIENLLILIGIFPFIKNNSFILINIRKKLTYQIIKNLLKTRPTEKNKNIILFQKDLLFLYNNFTDLISYKWELIPSFSLLNNIRYIINHYYTDKFLDIYDNILNVNFKDYISKNKASLSYQDIKKLMSKYLKYI